MCNSSNSNNTPGQGKGQARPKFSWPELRKRIEFFEKERICYWPAGWGRLTHSLLTEGGGSGSV